MLRQLYHRVVPHEWRFLIYKLRNHKEIERLRSRVFPSEKGNFSLRSFDRHRCIFIHITKTAGTSVAKGLFEELPYHYTAQQYRVIYGRSTFNEYYKFCFVRNPWDRLYSAYSFLKGGGWNEEDERWAKLHLKNINSFNSFVLNWISPDRLKSHIHFWPQSKFICDRKGIPLVNEVFYFENIEKDYERASQKLGIHNPLPHTNASKRASYKEAYSVEAIEKVKELYRQDIENFGYSFEGFSPVKISLRSFVHDQ